MKAKQLSLGIIALAIALTAMFSSCKKKKEEEVKDSDTSSAAVHEYASDMENQMIRIADEACRLRPGAGDLSSCAQIRFDTLSAVKTLTVNFSYNQSCQSSDGKRRGGALIISFRGAYRDSLTEITIRSQYYSVGDKVVGGSKVITNKGHNAAGHLVYDINGSIWITSTMSDHTINSESKRQREWISGESTPGLADDVYAFTGTASGNVNFNSIFQAEITSPLIRKMAPGCLNPTSGSVAFTPFGKATRYINYGDGGCDNLAIVTINDEPYIVFLP